MNNQAQLLMTPHRLNKEEIFEDRYTDLFRARFGHGAATLKYDRDRAARDLGLHIRAPGSLKLSNVRVWMQLKGIHAETMGAHELSKRTSISISLPVEDVKRWYTAPEAVYLVVYLEALDQFIGQDVREIVDDMFSDNRGDFIAKMESSLQEEISLHVSVDAIIDETRIAEMLRHRSMRVDGPAWRGRPLGHRFDPLRSELSNLEPDLFVDVVEGLLTEHDYRIDQRLDAGLLLDGVRSGLDEAYLSIGTMYSTYEWIFQLSVEFGTSPGTDFREEGQTMKIQGKTAVLVHSRLGGHAKPAPEADRILQEMRDAGVKGVLAIVNAPESLVIGSYRAVLDDLYQIPQAQGSLAYSVLTCPLVFSEFHDRLRWKYVNFLWDDPHRSRVQIRGS